MAWLSPYLERFAPCSAFLAIGCLGFVVVVVFCTTSPPSHYVFAHFVFVPQVLLIARAYNPGWFIYEMGITAAPPQLEEDFASS